MNASIFFATSEDFPDLTADDRIAVEVLEARGVSVEPLVWSRPHAGLLGEGSTVVIRSCWDYHQRFHEFSAWLDSLERASVRVVNPPGLLRWNLHKRYLLDLAERGNSIVPTDCVEQDDARTLGDVMSARGWHEVVVKPAVSLSAYETWRADRRQPAEDEARFARLKTSGDVLVQPYLPEIASEGEWSLVFFGEDYSHAVRKRPRHGDFRVQVEHGGSAVAESPPRAVLEGATRLMKSLGAPPSYARVDGVVADGLFLLMELECIDPVLFFATDTRAAVRFADQLLGSTSGTEAVPKS